MATGSKARKSVNGNAKANPALRKELARRLAGAVLPGDGDFTADALDAAAAFLLEAADDREVPDRRARHAASPPAQAPPVAVADPAPR